MDPPHADGAARQRAVRFSHRLLLLLALLAWPVLPILTPAAMAAPPRHGEAAAAHHTRVRMQTSMGAVTIELLDDTAPVTVGRFLELADAGFYDGTVFHRVLPNLIQGGGYTAALERKERPPEIVNEAAETPSNLRGTLAIVHQPGRPHSATAEFFINVKDNTYLDHRNASPRGYGWAVFGQVVEGMEVVDGIAALATGARGPFLYDCPADTVLIVSIRRSAP